MTHDRGPALSRRGLAKAGAAAALTTAAGGLPRPSIAQGTPVRVGLMLPFSGTFAALGENIAAAFELFLAEKGGRFGGRAVQIVRLDDESDPSKAVQNVNRLVGRDRVEALVGTVHSGVVMALVQASRERGVPLIIPNAGNAAATRRYEGAGRRWRLPLPAAAAIKCRYRAPLPLAEGGPVVHVHEKQERSGAAPGQGGEKPGCPTTPRPRPPAAACSAARPPPWPGPCRARPSPKAGRR